MRKKALLKHLLETHLSYFIIGNYPGGLLTREDDD